MNIEELEDKHQEIIGESDLGVIEELKDSVDYDEEADYTAKRATKLSIEFAISVLEELNVIGDVKNYSDGAAWSNLLYFKTRELKQYLDEKI